MFQNVTAEYCAKGFIGEWDIGTTGNNGAGMTFQSPAVDVQTNITVAVRRPIQQPAVGFHAPRPADYQQLLPAFLSIFGSGLYLRFLSWISSIQIIICQIKTTTSIPTITRVTIDIGEVTKSSLLKSKIH